MIKAGKQTKINYEANKILHQKYSENGYGQSCEIGRAFSDITIFKNCTREWQGYAHKHKRLWYRAQPEKLAYLTETVRACTNCHNVIEHSKELTEKVFSILRPDNMKEPTTKITKGQEKKLSSKKPAWMFNHPCKNCKRTTATLLCIYCGQMSI
jgi:RNA polymerase subunit RPABC4/transcription elongation factor Spt4